MKTIINSFNRIVPGRFSDAGSRFWLNRFDPWPERNPSASQGKFLSSFLQEPGRKRQAFHGKRNLLSSVFFTASVLSLGLILPFSLKGSLLSDQAAETAVSSKENRTSISSAVFPAIQDPLKSSLIRQSDPEDPSSVADAEKYSRDLFAETSRLQKLLAETEDEIHQIRLMKKMKTEPGIQDEVQDLFCSSGYLKHHLFEFDEYRISQTSFRLMEMLDQALKIQRSLFETYESLSLQKSFISETSAGPLIEDTIQNTDSLKLSEPENNEFSADAAGIGSAGSDSDETLFDKACPAVFDGLDGFIGSSGSLMLPASGPISAGTWSYPGGGMHLGMDLAVGMYTPLRAPADGVILYASAPVSSNCGYLGNTCGWPYGGGNTLCMLAVTDDQLYAVSLCHLSNDIRVSAGMRVSQGDVLALSGNSGNSSGPHTHIEVFALRTDLQSAASYFKNNGADFSFGCGWSAPATCSGIACRIRPESVF